MGNKRFDRSLSDRYDSIGKKLAIEIMSDLTGGKIVTENTKETSGNFTDGFWDQMYELPNGTRLLVEPEMKDAKWWGLTWDASRPFRYNTMDIPFRKKKNKADIFMVISTCECFAWVVHRKVIDNHFQETGGKPKVKRTIYEPEGAEYYSTPVEKGIFVCKKDGKWRKFNQKV